MVRKWKFCIIKKFRVLEMTYFLAKFDLMSLASPIFWSSESISAIVFFFNWDSLHARLNRHYKAWRHKKKKHQNMKVYRKSL